VIHALTKNVKLFLSYGVTPTECRWSPLS